MMQYMIKMRLFPIQTLSEESVSFYIMAREAPEKDFAYIQLSYIHDIV